MMKNFAYRLLPLIALFTLVACSKEEGPASELTLSVSRVALPATAGEAVTITITANRPWELTRTGTGFEVSATSGEAGESRIALYPTQDNLSDGCLLGQLTVRLRDKKQTLAIEVAQRPLTAPHTILLYMPGRDLASYFEQNIDGIREAVKSWEQGDCRILVCYQPRSHAEATLYEVELDHATGEGALKERDRYPFEASDPDHVAAMMASAKELAPAKSYGLIIGCHGKAWIPAEAGRISNTVTIQQITPSGTSIEVSDDLWHPLPGALKTRSFGDPGHELDIPQLAEVLHGLPCRFDYLLLDDCFMANIETLYDLRTCVDYIVASPCEIMAAGFPYDRIVGELCQHKSGTRKRLEEVCREFYNFYEHDWNSVSSNAQSGCISLCITAKLDAMADIVREIYATAPQSYDLAALQAYEGLHNHVFFDLGDFLHKGYSDAGLLAAFDERLDEAFPPASRLNTAAFFSVYNNAMNSIGDGCYSGVSTSEPSRRYRDYLVQTAWYQAVH